MALWRYVLYLIRRKSKKMQYILFILGSDVQFHCPLHDVSSMFYLFIFLDVTQQGNMAAIPSD